MPTAETRYRIWVNRSDTHNRIGNEDIWVGNIPNDGRSKITSGMTIGPNYSYVEFASWEDLLDAIGVHVTTVDVTPGGTLEQQDNPGPTPTQIDVTPGGTLEQQDNPEPPPPEPTTTSVNPTGTLEQLSSN